MNIFLKGTITPRSKSYPLRPEFTLQNHIRRNVWHIWEIWSNPTNPSVSLFYWYQFVYISFTIFYLYSGNTPETRGTAFVVYEDIFDAKNACDHLSGFNVCNRYLVVLYYQVFLNCYEILKQFIYLCLIFSAHKSFQESWCR